MTRFGLLIAAFVLCLATVGWGIPLPKIPCTFVADVTYTVTYMKQKTSNRYTHYSLYTDSFQAFSQVGNIEDYSNGNASMILVPPNRYTLITPFFDRKLCTTLPIKTSMQCFSVDSDASVRGENELCHFNKKRHCNVFAFTDMFERDQVYYVYNDSTADAPELDSIIIYGDSEPEVDEEYHFHKWSLETPDKSHFAPAKDQPCTDLVSSSKADAILHTAQRSYSSFALNNAIIRESNLASVYVNDGARLSRLSAEAKTWYPRPAKIFEGLTLEEAAKKFKQPNEYLRKPSMKGESGQQAFILPPEAIPESFDARTQWPQCGIDKIRDQGSCGSCWAFGAAESFSDRACIAANLKQPVPLSPQYLVDCDTDLDGCGGGYVDIAWNDLTKIGITSEACWPYAGKASQCPTKCADGTPIQLAYSNKPYSSFVPFNRQKTEAAIQTEIMTHGPVETAFWVFDDFMNYGGGIYEKLKSASFAGGHAVKIIGWGYDATQEEPYWLCANSWGDSWGENGFFRIKRGNSECGIEDQIATGIPKV